jgi:hypothetical protein
MQAMDTEVPDVSTSTAPSATSPQPEREAYCAFLVCQLLVDQKQFEKVCTYLNGSSC